MTHDSISLELAAYSPLYVSSRDNWNGVQSICGWQVSCPSVTLNVEKVRLKLKLPFAPDDSRPNPAGVA